MDLLRFFLRPVEFDIIMLFHAKFLCYLTVFEYTSVIDTLILFAGNDVAPKFIFISEPIRRPVVYLYMP